MHVGYPRALSFTMRRLAEAQRLAGTLGRSRPYLPTWMSGWNTESQQPLRLVPARLLPTLLGRVAFRGRVDCRNVVLPWALCPFPPAFSRAGIARRMMHQHSGRDIVTLAPWEASRTTEHFDSLPKDVREAWIVLGWTQELWPNRDKINPRSIRGSKLQWIDLSSEQKQAANYLGYTAETWEAKHLDMHAPEVPFLVHQHLAWSDLDEISQKAWTTLGYNGWLWDAGSLPATCKKDWIDLTAEQRSSAITLGYTRASWDEDEPENEDELGLHGFKTFLAFFFSPLAFILLCSMMSEGDDERRAADKTEDQTWATGIWRVEMKPRENWQGLCEALGFRFHSADGIKWSANVRDPYWNESAAYVLSRETAAETEAAMWELHNMCLMAVDKVVNDPVLLDVFEIPVPLRKAVKESWWRRQPDLIGRFDLLMSEGEAPKLLEYNADTPTLLLEAAIVQVCVYYSWINDMAMAEFSDCFPRCKADCAMQADWARHHGVNQMNRGMRSTLGCDSLLASCNQ
jgi:hypothetical protein